MEENFFLKASAIQNLTDARYFTSKGVRMMGFCFDPTSAHYIEPLQAQEIINWIEGPEIVGEFGNQTLEEIKEISMILNLDWIQAPEFKYPEVRKIGTPVIIEMDWANFEEINLNADDYLQLNIQNSSSHQLIKVKKLCETFPIILSLDFSKNDLLEITTLNPAGINILSEPETQLGEKSFEQWDQLFELLEEKL